MDKFPRFSGLKTLARKLQRDYRIWRACPSLPSPTLTDQQSAFLDSYEFMIARALRICPDRLQDAFADLADVLGVRSDCVQAYFQPLLEEVERPQRRCGEDLLECLEKMIRTEVSRERSASPGEEAPAKPVDAPFRTASVPTADGDSVSVRYLNTEDDEVFPTNWEFLRSNRGVATILPDRVCCKCASQSRDARSCTCTQQRSDSVYLGHGSVKKLARIPPSAIVECRPECSCAKEKCSLTYFAQGWERLASRDLFVARVAKQGDFLWTVRTATAIGRLEFVLEVTGEVVTDSASGCLTVRFHPGLSLDSSVSGSLARFLAHSCGPNLSVVRVYEKSRVRIALFSSRDIRPGEELTVNFAALMNLRSKLHCECGSKECEGGIGT